MRLKQIFLIVSESHNSRASKENTLQTLTLLTKHKICHHNKLHRSCCDTRTSRYKHSFNYARSHSVGPHPTFTLSAAEKLSITRLTTASTTQVFFFIYKSKETTEIKYWKSQKD